MTAPLNTSFVNFFDAAARSAHSSQISFPAEHYLCHDPMNGKTCPPCEVSAIIDSLAQFQRKEFYWHLNLPQPDQEPSFCKAFSPCCGQRLRILPKELNDDNTNSLLERIDNVFRSKYSGSEYFQKN